MLFQHTATRRWLQCYSKYKKCKMPKFQHTATRRWLLFKYRKVLILLMVSTHSHPKVAAAYRPRDSQYKNVSTHSHPKVAAYNALCDYNLIRGFNTQPPEGGCNFPFFKFTFYRRFQHTATRRWLPGLFKTAISINGFNTQPPEGGCPIARTNFYCFRIVSTHSHPKVAAPYIKKQEKSAN